MKLLSSLKERKRYILFEIMADKIFTIEEVEDRVIDAIKDFIGTLGLAKAAPLLVKEKSSGNEFVLKVNHKFVDEVKSALILVKEIKGIPVIIKSVITSGTLKKVSE